MNESVNNTPTGEDVAAQAANIAAGMIQDPDFGNAVTDKLSPPNNGEAFSEGEIGTLDVSTAVHEQVLGQQEDQVSIDVGAEANDNTDPDVQSSGDLIEEVAASSDMQVRNPIIETVAKIAEVPVVEALEPEASEPKVELSAEDKRYIRETLHTTGDILNDMDRSDINNANQGYGSIIDRARSDRAKKFPELARALRAAAFGNSRDSRSANGLLDIVIKDVRDIAGDNVELGQRLRRLLEPHYGIATERQRDSVEDLRRGLERSAGNRASYAQHLERNVELLGKTLNNSQQRKEVGIFLNGVALGVAPAQLRMRYVDAVRKLMEG